MVLLVDAYNVLHVTGVLPPHLAGLDAPALAELVATARGPGWGGGGATLVCDGVRPRGWPTSVEGVELRFAGPGRDADTLIERMIGDSPDPRRLTVVSSDRRVRTAGKRAGCRVLTSEGFLSQLAARVDSPRTRAGSPAAGKPEVPLDAFALRRWLAEFDISPEELRRMAGAARSTVQIPSRLPPSSMGEEKRRPSPTPSASGRGSQIAPSRPRPSSMGEEKGELSDEAMRSMLAEAMKMWAAEGVPADLDLTAWLDALANPPPDHESSHGQRGGRSRRSR